MLSGLGLVNLFTEVPVLEIIPRNSKLLYSLSYALTSSCKIPVKVPKHRQSIDSVPLAF